MTEKHKRSILKPMLVVLFKAVIINAINRSFKKDTEIQEYMNNINIIIII